MPMENVLFFVITGFNLLFTAFIWLKSSEMAGVTLKIRSLERSIASEVKRIEDEIPKAEISLAGQILEATDLVETVRHAQKKMAGRQGGRGNKAEEPAHSYLDETLPREVRHQLMREQVGA